MISPMLDYFIQEEIDRGLEEGMEMLIHAESRLLARLARITQGALMGPIRYRSADCDEDEVIEQWAHVVVPVGELQVGLAKPWQPEKSPTACLVVEQAKGYGPILLANTWEEARREVGGIDKVIQAILDSLAGIVVHPDDPWSDEIDPRIDADESDSDNPGDGETRRITPIMRIRDLCSRDEISERAERVIEAAAWFQSGIKKRRNGGDGGPPPCPIAYQNPRRSSS